MKEIEIKIKLIDYLHSQIENGDMIGSEFRFDFGMRRADVILLNHNVATAFEIKGSGDNIERLDDQVNSYKKYFDYCYIVCEASNLKQIRENITKNVGLMVVNNTGIIVQRTANRFFKQSKESLASTIDASFLRKICGGKNLRSKHDLCVFLAKNRTIQEVRDLSREHLRIKINESYSLFQNELGKYVHPDDILTLTRMPSSELYELSKTEV